MSIGKSKQAYTPPPDPAPPPPNAPTTADASVQAAGASGRASAARTQGLAGTIMTSPQGVMAEASTSKKQLLGQ